VIVPDEALALLLSFCGIVAIVFVHLFVHRFRFLQAESGPWISASAGVAIAYVFVDILPLLASQQAKLLATSHTGWLRYLEHHAYLVAMLGFAFHYLVALDLGRGMAAGPVSSWTRRIGAASFLFYAFLIGYLIGEKWDHGSQPGLIFAVAMALHFVGLDHLAYQDAPALYVRRLRHVLAALTLAGWVLAIGTRVSDQVFLLCFSFLAGGIIVVAMSVELPRLRLRESEFAAFLAGMAILSVLLLLAEKSRGLA
jgi:hypothetical protein